MCLRLWCVWHQIWYILIYSKHGSCVDHESFLPGHQALARRHGSHGSGGARSNSFKRLVTGLVGFGKIWSGIQFISINFKFSNSFEDLLVCCHWQSLRFHSGAVFRHALQLGCRGLGQGYATLPPVRHRRHRTTDVESSFNWWGFEMFEACRAFHCEKEVSPVY